MATHEKCDGCLTDPADYHTTPRPVFRYRNWEPGNWLRREHEMQLAGKRCIVVGGSGEAEIYANDPPAKASKHLHYVAGECGYYPEPMHHVEVFSVKYGASVTETRKRYWTDALYELVWVNDQLDRIDRITTDEHENETRVCTWSRHTADPRNEQI